MKIFICFVIAILLYSILPTIYFKIKGTSFLDKLSGKKYLCLTFDDGPDEKYTEKLLDLLKKYDVKVTFFTVTTFANNNKYIIERMKSEGHAVALHSLEHKSALWKSPFYTNKDFRESMKIMENLKINVDFYRPPWGYLNLMTLLNLKKHNLNLVLWDVMAQDWRGNTTSDEISRKLIDRTKNKSVICLHDGRGKNEAPQRTIEALEKTIPLWISQGYKFLKVGEIYE